MSIQLRYAARCEAAGRDHNEDNFLVDYNLNDDTWGFKTDEIISLEGKGSLLVVCDGMGGMNAGEVASAIAIETIKDLFDHKRLTEEIISSPKNIQQYIYSAIQAADAAIKKDAKENPEHEGMGTTIVLVWLINGKAYVGWCGDSRAYRYNPQNGLERLSHDHSYVQELVDAGKLTEELAFDHPNNNIITRSLGDPRGKAIPDVKEYDLYDGDIVLLCSDGLCGCLRDNEIAQVMSQNNGSMQECRDALWTADEAAGWHDNVTILLAQVTKGAPTAPMRSQTGEKALSNSAVLRKKNSKLTALVGVLIVIIVLLTGVFAYMHYASKQNIESPSEEVVVPDSANQEQVLPTLEEQPNISEPQAIKEQQPAKEKNTAPKAEVAKPTPVAPPISTPKEEEESSAAEERKPVLTPIVEQKITDQNEREATEKTNDTTEMK